jgi:hypothetical protein
VERDGPVTEEQRQLGPLIQRVPNRLGHGVLGQ